MAAPKKQEFEFGGDVDIVDTVSSDDCPLLGLEQFLSADISRLTLKWESSNHGNKLVVGVDTYLPLDASRGCFSLELPHEETAERDTTTGRTNSARNSLSRLVSKITEFSPQISQLDLEDFGKKQDGCGTTLDIEDVFEAFAKNRSSPWRSITVLRTWNCDMNSNKGNNCFELAIGDYPEGLEEVYVHDPKGSVLSSSIFRIASRSKKLGRFYVFDSCNMSNQSENEYGVSDRNNTSVIHLHRFNGSRMTQSSIDALCEVLASPNRLLEINQLPFREILQLPETDFCRILEATTQTPNSLGSFPSTKLRFPVVPPTMVSRLTILATRSETLRFYLLYKRSLEFLRNPSKQVLSPFLLKRCQKQKTTRQYIPYGRHDLLFAMMQDSLQGILER